MKGHGRRAACRRSDSARSSWLHWLRTRCAGLAPRSADWVQPQPQLLGSEPFWGLPQKIVRDLWLKNGSTSVNTTAVVAATKDGLVVAFQECAWWDEELELEHPPPDLPHLLPPEPREPPEPPLLPPLPL